MPEPEAYPMRIAEEFWQSLAAIWSERLLAHIREVLETLQRFPLVGSANVRQSLVDLYGQNLRKLPVSTFVIIYRFENGVIDVLALVYGPNVR